MARGSRQPVRAVWRTRFAWLCIDILCALPFAGSSTHVGVEAHLRALSASAPGVDLPPIGSCRRVNLPPFALDLPPGPALRPRPMPTLPRRALAEPAEGGGHRVVEPCGRATGPAVLLHARTASAQAVCKPQTKHPVQMHPAGPCAVLANATAAAGDDATLPHRLESPLAASATTVDALILDAECEILEAEGGGGGALRTRALLQAFPSASQEKITQHVAYHRRALRHFFDRSIRSGPQVDKFLFQHPAIRPLLELCLRDPCLLSSAATATDPVVAAAPSLGCGNLSSAADRAGMTPVSAISAERLKALFLFVRTAVVSEGDCVTGRGTGKIAGRQRRHGASRAASSCSADKLTRTTPPSLQSNKASCGRKDAGRNREETGRWRGRPKSHAVAGTRQDSDSRAPGSGQHGRASALKHRNGAMRCTHKKCTKYASYGDPLERVKRFCSAHKKAGNVDLKNRLCMFPEGCTSRATYGSFGSVLPCNNLAAAAPAEGFGVADSVYVSVSAGSTAGQGQDAEIPRQPSCDGAVGDDGVEQGLRGDVDRDARGRERHVSADDHQNVGLFPSGLDSFRADVAGVCINGGVDAGAFQSQPRSLEPGAGAWHSKGATTDSAAPPSAEDSAAVAAAAAAADFSARSRSRSRSSSSGNESDGGRAREVFCEVKGCRKLPTFGSLAEGGRARRCARHKLPQHADVKNPRCIIELANGMICNGRATWADASDLRAVACAQHRRPHFVNIMQGLPAVCLPAALAT